MFFIINTINYKTEHLGNKMPEMPPSIKEARRVALQAARDAQQPVAFNPNLVRVLFPPQQVVKRKLVFQIQ